MACIAWLDRKATEAGCPMITRAGVLAACEQRKLALCAACWTDLLRVEAGARRIEAAFPPERFGFSLALYGVQDPIDSSLALC
jgi:hypothetical protein